ncbi:adhesion G-protein coupled receptor G2 [Antennarius striatus]|uniref:adhesion G-protein coupled receptor G2 n=1 Tax=Antennarius striatus TaxID=241820 RepID=UPI0035B1C3B9
MSSHSRWSTIKTVLAKRRKFVSNVDCLGLSSRLDLDHRKICSMKMMTVIKSFFSHGSSCWCSFAASLRVKKTTSHTGHLTWLYIQLLLLLAGQASCNQTTTTLPLLSTTINAQTSVYYFLDIAVDVNGKEMNETEIKSQLIQGFKNKLESCKSPNQEELVVPTSFSLTAPTSTSESTTVTTRMTSQSDPANKKASNLFQDIEVDCTETTKSCAVVLKLSHSVPSCCILRTLCAASSSVSDIQIVGRKADRTNRLINDCNSNPDEEDSCVFRGHADASCEDSESAYVVHQRNSSECFAVMENNSCSCSDYCSRTDAYYTFQISIKDPDINISHVLSMISKINKTSNCSEATNVTCPQSIIASEYKSAVVTCGSTTTNCSVILGFSRKVPICDVSNAVANVFDSEEKIHFTGPVTRAAICGNSTISDNPLNSQLTWVEVNLKPDNFCLIIEESNILDCQYGETVVVILEEQCVFEPKPEPSTTPGPNVTTAHPNATTLSVNLTPTSPNTTTPAPNATALFVNVSTAPNATTPSVNVTTTSPSTTTAALNATTVAVNVTTSLTSNATGGLVTVTTVNTATTTANASVLVTTETMPTITESAEGQASALLELTRNVSSLNSSQVDQLVDELENLLSGETVSLELGNLSIHIVSNLLGASPETLSNSSNRIIGVVDTVAFKLVLTNPTESLLAQDLGVSVSAADGTNFQETVFSISDPNTIQVNGNSRTRRSVRNDSSIPQGSIRLPDSLTQDLTSVQQQQVSRVQFNFYQKSTVFQDRSLGQRRLNSGILGSSVANLTLTGLQDDVVIRLKNTQPVPANFVAVCVFWDFTLNDRTGGWNSSGCFVKNSTDKETVCSCNHLTSFAILLDLSREPITNRVQATILTFITYIGCGVSAIFLSVTLLTYLSFGKLRKDIPSKILIQLCLALLLLNLVFLVDAWLALYPNAVGLCISTAWFLHYFLLATFTWMGLEAVHMYLALVKVFNSYVSHYMLRFSSVGWGVPMIVVIIVIAVDKDNYGLVSYGRFPDGTSDDFCWLRNDIAFYVAVVAYFCVIFLFNFIMFIVVMVQLCRIKKQNPHNSLHRSAMQDARSVVGITLLLGLTWGFAFFAWGPVNLPFMYLFSIFNSFQGFFIFLFNCALKENVRRQWRIYLCCGKMRLPENSEWSRTATQKTAKKSSVTKATSFHSINSNSNNSTSSSTFLVNGSTDQMNSIGSPFDDRAITADEYPSMDVVLNEINRQHIERHEH